ncbi:MAG: diaminopimelate decarboxylase [Micromonosporaceae bacterium]
MTASGLTTAGTRHREVVTELTRRYGTPLYVYDLAVVRAAVQDLLAALPAGVEVYYSAKANPHPVLIAAVAGLGLRVEISSRGELEAAARAGVPAQRCLYTGPAKTREEMAHGVARGVRLFSVESPVDRQRLTCAAGEPVGYLVRLNGRTAPGPAGLRMTGVPTQFGVSAETLAPGSALFRPAGNARPVGVHLFSASNVPDGSALLGELTTNLAVAVHTCARMAFQPELVDLGGGFGAPFATPGPRPAYPYLRQGLSTALDEALPGWRLGEPRVAVESGRYLVAGAGTLLTQVMDRKAPDGREYLVCDAGVNALGGMSGLGRLLPAAQPEHQPVDSAAAVLTGPLCTPLDVLSRAARVGDVAVGDVLAIPNVGGYGLTASLVAFLGRPLPVEVVLDGDEVVAVRQLTISETAW